MWSHEIYACFSHLSGECSEKRHQVSMASPEGKEEPQQVTESLKFSTLLSMGPENISALSSPDWEPNPSLLARPLSIKMRQ